MDYITFIGVALLLLNSLLLSVNCATVPLGRQKRQSISSDPDRIFFQEEFEEYKNQLKYAQVNDGDKRFGLDEETIKQLEASNNKKSGRRNRRQMRPRFGSGFNDISRGGGFGMFPGFFPMPGDDNDIRPVWEITPFTTRRPTQQTSSTTRRTVRQGTTTLPGPPAWPTPPSQCVRNCQVTPQYNPVCGTDGVTYTNLARLQCELRCGKKIGMNHYGNCSKTTTQAPRARRSEPSSRRRQQ